MAVKKKVGAEVQIDLEGKTALVTGGASGLGRMIAEGLLRAGARVILTSRRSVEVAVREMASLGVCIGIEADLAQEGALDRLASDLSEITPALQILVNNAGTTWGASLETFPDHAWPSVLDLNVRVPFATVQRLLPLLEAGGTLSDPARVINIGSVAGVFSAGLKAYSYFGQQSGVAPPWPRTGDRVGAEGYRREYHRSGIFPYADDGASSGGGGNDCGNRVRDTASPVRGA
jgi:NADP-dependent 3-hydroxy acid dehydrogenase YdfG